MCQQTNWDCKLKEAQARKQLAEAESLEQDVRKKRIENHLAERMANIQIKKAEQELKQQEEAWEINKKKLSFEATKLLQVS